MLDAAVVALAETTDQIAALRNAGVVDAGAAGYCAILEGCKDYLLFGSISAPAPLAKAAEIFNPHPRHATEDIKYRFCTECMLIGSLLEPASIRNALHPLGDSMVVAGSSQRVRIHIHTDDPERVFLLAAEFGEVLNTKADDMRSQAKSLANSNKTVAIVTDSAADYGTRCTYRAVTGYFWGYKLSRQDWDGPCRVSDRTAKKFCSTRHIAAHTG
jgi:dihydroxyacetone kinase-like predicted kinase